MPSIAYPTSLSVPGPWLLDTKNLLELDSLIDACERRMSERRDAAVDYAVSEKKAELLAQGKTEEQLKDISDQILKSVVRKHPFNIKDRRLTVYLSGGRTAEGISFAELGALPHVHEEVPRGFALKAGIYQDEIKVELGSSYDRNLKISVSSKDEDFAQELYGKLQNWVSDIQPKKWLRMWLDADFLRYMLSAAMIVGCVVAIGLALIPVEGPSLVRQQAQDLARQGVNSSNETKALQLILSIESGYEPSTVPSVHVHFGPRFWIYFGLACSVVGALGRPPKGAIGLWGGKRAVESQRRWVRIVSITIPSLAVSSVFIRLLIHWLGWMN